MRQRLFPGDTDMDRRRLSQRQARAYNLRFSDKCGKIHTRAIIKTTRGAKEDYQRHRHRRYQLSPNGFAARVTLGPGPLALLAVVGLTGVGFFAGAAPDGFATPLALLVLCVGFFLIAPGLGATAFA
jgi:hypothetical protein